MPAELHFYTRPDCPLCDEFIGAAEAIGARHGLPIRKRNIEELDVATYQKHRYRIPVVEYAAGDSSEAVELGWGRLDEQAMEAVLRETLGSGS